MPYSHILLIHHGRPCPYCGVTMRVQHTKTGYPRQTPTSPSRDHVIPRSLMPGQGTIIVCRKCNHDKGDMTVSDWYVDLVVQGDPRATIVKAWMKDNRHRMLCLREAAKAVSEAS